MSWADDHGYQHITCHCGWSGWSDTGVCERCPQPSHDKCERCGCEMDTGYRSDPCRSTTAVDEVLCEDCAHEDGVCHHTTTIVKYHTARRDHKDGMVKKGDRYCKTVHMGYVVNGGRWLSSFKRVIKRAHA